MNNTSSFQQKVNYIKEHYPNYARVNPYTDRLAINDIKALLVKGGFTKSDIRYITDSVVIRIINAAQNIKIPKRMVSGYGRTYGYKNSGRRKAV